MLVLRMNEIVKLFINLAKQGYCIQLVCLCVCVCVFFWFEYEGTGTGFAILIVLACRK